MKRDKWKPSKYSVLCEKHFTPDDYVRVKGQLTDCLKPTLKPNAVPSVFDFPPHLNKATKPRNPAKRKAPSPKKEVPKKKPRISNQPVMQDHNYCISPAKVIPKLKKSLEKKRKKIRALTSKNLRKEKTIKGLVTKLENARHLSKEQSQSLLSNFGHMTKDLFINKQKHAGKSKATIRAWAAAIKCEPGFLTCVIEHLQNSLDVDDKDCFLLVDEMSIKKEVIWDKKNKKFAGNTDYGPILAEEQDSIATNALVVMAVRLKKPWFHPFAYFLVDRVNAKMQAQIIKEGINLLTDAGLDGCAKNIATARCLGCNIDKFDGSFKHPSRPNKTLYVILDVCHMLKLARNSLGDMKVFFTESGDMISWQYITALYNVQQGDVLHLGNKLKATHSKFGKSYKGPLTLENLDELRHYLLDTISYLTELKDNNGTKLMNGPRKTFILGFAVSAKLIMALAKELLSRNYNKFKYMLTYLFSQDQLEMFFSKIRSYLGWNNNLNALQFKWALRALLQKNQVTAAETGNCSVIEEEKFSKEAEGVDSKVAALLNSSTIWHEDVLAYIGGYIAKIIPGCIKCAELPILLLEGRIIYAFGTFTTSKLT
ncbi:THAP domain-containing 9 [Paramuricea clavata]|uniref:THAP domain-containing 9, partial n=1 Tax=Paramuricea clavata TaxID=317549 RepID=A0A7D9H8Y8_PARCT|nr:THAP domain-containing 9 [Paramuricea clavata]